ncbi:MAG: MFS transporter [Acidimicrobiales bacterium]
MQYKSTPRSTPSTTAESGIQHQNDMETRQSSKRHIFFRNVSYAKPGAGLSNWLVVTIAAAGGLVVANLYYVQPLLHAISVEFNTTPAAAGLLVTTTQAGFAAGLLLLVPLGDLVERRRMIIVLLVLSAAALAAFAISPSLILLVMLAVAIGTTSVVAQVLVSFVATVSTEKSRGAMVGWTMSGLLLGIVLARTISGALAQVAGWRSIYWAAAVAMLALALILGHVLPRLQPQFKLRGSADRRAGLATPQGSHCGVVVVSHGFPPPPCTARLDERLPSPACLSAEPLGYRQLLHSVVVLFIEEPVLRRRSLYGATSFAAFSVLWTNLAFLLSGAPYHYNTIEIGLFGLAGATGALCASVAGKLTDRGHARIASITFFAATTLAFGLLALGRTSLIALVAGVILVDLGVWGAQVSNQSLIYRLRPHAQSRITTIYMTSYFIGGAIGSATSAILYAKEGWIATCALGSAFGLIAIVFWLLERHHLGDYYAKLTPVQK